MTTPPGYWSVFKGARSQTDTVLSTRLNAQEQRELQGRMEKKQMKEFMTVSPSPFHPSYSCTSLHSSLRFLFDFAYHVPLDVLEAGPKML